LKPLRRIEIHHVIAPEGIDINPDALTWSTDLAQSVAPGTSTLSICWQAQRLLYFHTFDIRHIHISKGK